MAPACSAPAPKPCRIRSATSRIGAQIPTCAPVGSTPIRVLAPPIRAMVIIRIHLRPSLSPRAPKNRPPIGRAKKPMASVAKLATVAAESPSAGKKILPKISADASEYSAKS